MLICLCHGVPDREVRRLVREGARSWREVARACGAGASCGGCRESVHALVAETLAELERREPLLPEALAVSPIAP